MQQFVSTYKPEQWGAAVKMLYDTIVVPAAPRTPQPSGNQAPIERMASRRDAMGI